MKKATCYKVFLSAHVGFRTVQENRLATQQLRIELGVNFSSVSETLGLYEGESEDSFCVEVYSMKGLGEILAIAQMYQQEAVLVEDSLGNCFMFGCKNHEVKAFGRAHYYFSMNEVRNAYGRTPDSYTLFKDSGRVMIAES